MRWSDSLILIFIQERFLASIIVLVMLTSYYFMPFNIILTVIAFLLFAFGIAMHGSDNSGLTANIFQFLVVISFIIVTTVMFLNYKPINRFVRLDVNQTYAYTKGDNYTINIIKDHKILYSFTRSNAEFLRLDYLDVNITESNNKWFHSPDTNYKVIGGYVE